MTPQTPIKDTELLPIATLPAPREAVRERPVIDQEKRERQTFVVSGIVIAVLAFALVYAILKPGHSVDRWVLMAVVMAALGFDFVNGMNDSGNAIATVISTRVLTPLAALFMAAILNFVGALLFEGVAKSIAGKIVDTQALHVTPLMVLCGLIGAIGWSYLMARIGMPISMSHALIGGLVGVFLTVDASMLNYTFIGEIGMWMVLAPIIGITAGWLLMVAIMWLFHRAAPSKINHHFRILQIISSGTMALMHGANDAQKAMGIITLALVAANFPLVVNADGPAIPLWVKLACATVIALGTGLGGRRVIKTLGHKIIKLQPVHGFAAETVASATIFLATHFHIPISTTHIISSSILGVGSSKRLSAVRWGVAGNIVSAWIFTIPTCGAVAALLYTIVRITGLEALLG